MNGYNIFTSSPTTYSFMYMHACSQKKKGDSNIYTVSIKRAFNLILLIVSG